MDPRHTAHQQQQLLHGEEVHPITPTSNTAGPGSSTLHRSHSYQAPALILDSSTHHLSQLSQARRQQSEQPVTVHGANLCYSPSVTSSSLAPSLHVPGRQPPDALITVEPNTHWVPTQQADGHLKLASAGSVHSAKGGSQHGPTDWFERSKLGQGASPVPPTSLYAPSAAEHPTEAMLPPGGNSSHHHASHHHTNGVTNGVANGTHYDNNVSGHRGASFLQRGMSGSRHGSTRHGTSAFSQLQRDGSLHKPPLPAGALRTPSAAHPDFAKAEPVDIEQAGPHGTIMVMNTLAGPMKETHQPYTNAAHSARAWTSAYFSKWRGVAGQRPGPRDTWMHMAWGWLGAFIAISVIAVLHQYVSPDIDLPLLVASFGASAVLLFGVPASPLAQPRNFVGGHFVSALTGIIVRHIFPDKLVWLSSGLGMATALLAQQITRTTHPPGGATALIAASAANIGPWSGFQFLVTMIAGSFLMLLVALIVNNVSADRRYPVFWF